MDSDRLVPCSLFGTFNLHDGSSRESFKAAFDAFCGHLNRQGYVGSWRMWERSFHEGYDRDFPETCFIVEMCFHNYDAALGNWSYIVENAEPIRSLHGAVTRQVRDAHFVLCDQVT